MEDEDKQPHLSGSYKKPRRATGKGSPFQATVGRAGGDHRGVDARWNAARGSKQQSARDPPACGSNPPASIRWTTPGSALEEPDADSRRSLAALDISTATHW